MESQPGRYEFLPHTADAKFKAYGRTMVECFRNAAAACFGIITEAGKVEPRLRFDIAARAQRPEALLFDFLDQLLFLLDTEGLLVRDVEELEITARDGKYSLTGTAVGDRHKGYEVSGNIKAVTYNEMHLKGPERTGRQEGEPGAWECQVVVDL